jgi:bifunctional UDP-N-acetylglucosamine pyrophosphorylase/glucosamine-1-phosphate N-acetyltransferase
VLHELAGKPLLQHVVDAGRALEPEQIIAVVGHGGELVQAAMQGQDLDFVEQREPSNSASSSAPAMRCSNASITSIPATRCWCCLAMCR